MNNKTRWFLLAAVLGLSLPAVAQERLVLGGRAVIMVADAVYLFEGMSGKVAAVGGADQGMGVFLSAIDPAFSSKPVIDKSAGAEVYASLRPDLVIFKQAMRKTLGPSLDALGIRQFYLDLETPEDYYKDLAALGDLFGQKARASSIIEFYKSRLAAISGRAGNAGNKPRVLLVQAPASAEGAWEVPPDGWIQTNMVERAGGLAIWKGANPGSGWAGVNAEQIAAWNPDIVFVVDYRRDAREAARKFASIKALSKVRAVAEGKVFGFAQDFYSWDQPDTRWILGLEWMARSMHPEAFALTSMIGSAREFFSFMYRMDSAVFDKVILPRLAGDL